MMETLQGQDAIGDANQEGLAQRLREAREYLGFSQELVAEKLGVPRPAISAIENSRRKVSGIELKQFAALYKRNVDYFLGTENIAQAQNDFFNALYRATGPLSEADKNQVLSFASFLQNAGKPPVIQEDSSDKEG